MGGRLCDITKSSRVTGLAFADALLTNFGADWITSSKLTAPIIFTGSSKKSNSAAAHTINTLTTIYTGETVITRVRR